MRNLIKSSRLYGFEDYNIVKMRSGVLNKYSSYSLPYIFDLSTVTYITEDNLPVSVGYDLKDNVVFSLTLCHENKELLTVAKKVYVHPSCKLSRSMMAEKYGKCLSPWGADAVVIPSPDFKGILYNKVALFANDDAKMLAIVFVLDDEGSETIDSLNDGVTFSEVKSPYLNDTYTQYDKNALYASKLFYRGNILSIPTSKQYVLDILTRQLPTDRLVYENTVQESLGTEDNKITLEALTNIYDMVRSTDKNTVGAGLKALSMMDYMHYSNSIKYVFNKLNTANYGWRYNKAVNSTSVKFMFKQLCPWGGRNKWPGYFDTEIYEQDFELFKQLVRYYDNSWDDSDPRYLLKKMHMYDFVDVHNNTLNPRLR